MTTFGIVGTNFISAWFVAACARTDGRAIPTAVCSRDLGRARQFGRAHGVPAAFDDLAAMVETVDAVYVASPIAAHAAQALTAISGGRHVLVEKTMGASASEVAQVLDAAAAAGVVAMEGVRNLHAPPHTLVADALGRLGAVRRVRFEKAQYSSRYDRVRAGERLNAFDPTLGNSALADIGVYCLQPALDLFGTPRTASGASVRLPNGFEAAGLMTLGYDAHVVEVAWSKVTAGVVPSVIDGEDASLLVDDLAEPSRIVLRHRGGDDEVILDHPTAAADTMHHEVLAFLDQVDAEETDRRWSDLTLASRRLMDAHLAREGGTFMSALDAIRAGLPR